MRLVSAVLALCAATEARYQLAQAPISGANGRNEFFDSYLFENSANSSFGFSIPLFSVTVPGYGREHPDIDQFRTVNFGNLALLGMVVLGTITLTVPLITSRALWLLQPDSILSSLGGGGLFRKRRDISIVHTSGDTSSSLVIEDSAIEQVIHWIDAAVNSVPAKYFVNDVRECLRLFICETNRYPRRFGIVGEIVKIIFPPQLVHDIQQRRSDVDILSEDDKLVLSYANATVIGTLDRDNSPTRDECIHTYYRGCWISSD